MCACMLLKGFFVRYDVNDGNKQYLSWSVAFENSDLSIDTLECVKAVNYIYVFQAISIN